jgi:hypothetical protein
MPSLSTPLSALRAAASLAALAVAAGCASVGEPLRSNLRSASEQACAAWFQRLDATVDRAGVRDAGAQRIAGFPYLRVDRFLASFRDEVATREDAIATWVGQLAELDRSAREAELSNLPADALAALPADSVAAALARTEQCATALRAVDVADETRRALLRANAQVPDHYSDAKRVIGLYALVREPFRRGVERWQDEARAAFARALAGPVTRYEPAGAPVPAQRIAQIVSTLRTDALGIPMLDAAAREALWHAFAPALEIETAGAFDRFGALGWQDGRALGVDISRPTVYRRIAFTRIAGHSHIQLVYTLWFPERPRTGAFDLLGGRLDGLIWRVTLDRQGRPLIFDTIHPCGCYHMFFPTAALEPRPPPEPGIEWAFVPLRLPTLDAGARITVRLAARTHYVVGVRVDGDAGLERATGERSIYAFADEAVLRTLPLATSATGSAFGPDGIVPGTERGERWLFWPMGIAEPGAMRQWGTHATAFVGRRHFDDADLIERRFAPAP